MLTTLILSLVLASDQPEYQKWVKDNPDAMERYIEKCRDFDKELRESGAKSVTTAIKKAESEIARIKKAAIRPGDDVVKGDVTIIYKSKESKERAIAAQQKIIDESRLIIERLDSVKDKTALALLESLDVNEIGHFRSIKVIQIADDSNCRGSISGFKGDVWIETNTANFVDDKEYVYEHPHIAIVIGTKRYITAIGGSRTVPLVAIIPMQKLGKNPKLNKNPDDK